MQQLQCGEIGRSLAAARRVLRSLEWPKLRFSDHIFGSVPRRKAVVPMTVSLDPLTIAIALLTVYLVTFIKGAFGGGFAILGIPFLALVMEPIAAGAVLAPLFVLSDLFALRYWRPATWSRPDLIVLVPAQVIGMVVGIAAMAIANREFVSLAVGLYALFCAATWFRRGGVVHHQKRSGARGAVAGTLSGIASMVAHAGGPPVAIYLLSLGLSKTIYAGTLFIFFLIGNIVKAGPWLILAQPGRELWVLMALCATVIPVAVWSGWLLHHRLNERRVYQICYALLFMAGLKLLWDAAHGLLQQE
jgi:uncharacterized protein